MRKRLFVGTLRLSRWKLVGEVGRASRRPIIDTFGLPQQPSESGREDSGGQLDRAIRIPALVEMAFHFRRNCGRSIARLIADFANPGHPRVGAGNCVFSNPR